MAARRGGRALGLTQRGAALLVAAGALLIVAYATSIDGLLFVSVFLGAAVGCALLSAHHRRPRLAVRRTFSASRITALLPVGVTLEVANLSERTIAPATWRDSWSWKSDSVWGSGRFAGESDSRSMPPLRARSTRSLSVARLQHELVPPRRGEFLMGPMVVRVEDPFGLAWASVAVGEGSTVTATPEVVPLVDLGLAFAETDGAARQVHSRALGGDHELTTRDYRVGDPMRRVHWRASAHHGELMVRQEEQRSSAEAGIVIDTRLEGYPDVPAVRRQEDCESGLFEWAVSFTASLAVYLREAGLLVHILETAEPQLAPGLQGAELLDGLAGISLANGSPTGVRLSVPGARDGLAGGTVFAVAPAADDVALQAMAAQRSGFSLAVAFVLSDDGMPVTDARAEAAAAVLRRAGWLCVVVDPSMTVDEAWLQVDIEARRHGDA